MESLIILKLLLFIISSFGTWEFIRRRSNVEVTFAPVLTIGIQISVLYVAGILNLLKFATYGMYGFGLVCAFYYVWKDRITILKRYLSEAGIQYLLVAVVLVCIALWNRVFNSYDNFSHWALVVQQMLQTNRFPNFVDNLIMFQQYPLGSSIYIYYFSKLVGKEEFVQMLAQTFMLIVSIVPILKFRLNRFVVIGLAVVFSNFIFCYCIQIQELQVDTLLPLLSMAAIFFMCTECMKSGSEKRVSVYWLIPLFVAIVQVKNSGVFFLAVAGVMMLMYSKRYALPWKQIVCFWTIPLISIYLWKRHCALVFVNASVSKHAMSLSNYKHTFLNKSHDDVVLIVKKMFDFSFTGNDLFYCVLFVCVAVLLAWFAHSHGRRLIGKFIAFVSVSYLTYMLGMLIMYLVSMPGGEATSLASSFRYRETILIAFYYASFALMLYSISSFDKRGKKICGSLLVLFVIVCSWTYGHFKGYRTIFNGATSPVNLWMRSLVQNGKVVKNSSYLVCIPRTDWGYVHYLGRYLFASLRTDGRVIQSLADMKDAGNFHYLLIVDHDNQIVKDWIAQHYPTQIGKDVIDLTLK